MQMLSKRKLNSNSELITRTKLATTPERWDYLTKAVCENNNNLNKNRNSSGKQIGKPIQLSLYVIELRNQSVRFFVNSDWFWRHKVAANCENFEAPIFIRSQKKATEHLKSKKIEYFCWRAALYGPWDDWKNIFRYFLKLLGPWHTSKRDGMWLDNFPRPYQNDFLWQDSRLLVRLTWPSSGRKSQIFGRSASATKALGLSWYGRSWRGKITFLFRGYQLGACLKSDRSSSSSTRRL